MANELDTKIDSLFRKYLNDLAKESEKLILKRFDKEQDVYGKSNFNKAPLKLSTKRERGSKGLPKSHPILKRTGKLRNSIEVNVYDFGFEVKSSLPYGDDLNDGKHSGFWGGHPIKSSKGPLMKPRKFLQLPNEAKWGGKIRKRLYKKLIKDYKIILRDFMIGRVLR